MSEPLRSTVWANSATAAPAAVSCSAEQKNDDNLSFSVHLLLLAAFRIFRI